MKNFLLTSLTCLFIGSLTPAAHCQTVTWTSSKPDIATVDANTGTITAKTEGTTTITSTTAAQNGKTVTSTKTVEVEWEPQSGSISGISSLASCKATGTMTATVNYGVGFDDLDDAFYTWKSSNTNIATVSNTSKTKNLKSITITAIGNGSATISCSVERAGKTLALSTKAVSVSGINPTYSFNSSSISFTTTGSRTYRAPSYSYPSGCTGVAPSFSYSSDNSGVAYWSGGYVYAGSTSSSTRVRVSTSNVTSWSSSIYVTGQYCTSCFYHGGRQYCGVQYAGKCWLDRNIGASRVAIRTCDTSADGTAFSSSASAASACPSGWRLPNINEAVAVARAATGNNRITENSYRSAVTAAQMFASPLKASSGYNCGYQDCWWLREGGGRIFNWYPDNYTMILVWPGYFHVRCVKN